jgi:uncharacterized membrane protein
MEDQAFRRERMLASGLLREVSQDEAALLARLMEAREAEQRPVRPRPEAARRPMAASHAR